MKYILLFAFATKSALCKPSYPPSYKDPPPPPGSPPSDDHDTLFPSYLQTMFNTPWKDEEAPPMSSKEIDSIRMAGNLSHNILNQVNQELNRLDPRQTSSQGSSDSIPYGDYSTQGYNNFNPNNYGSYGKMYDQHSYYDNGVEKPQVRLEDLSEKDVHRLSEQLYKEEQEDSNNNLALGLGIGIPVVIVVIAIVAFCYWYLRKRRQAGLPPMVGPKLYDNNYEKYQHSPALSSDDPWELSRTMLEIDYENKLGSGAFCNVFKGKVIGDAPVCQMLPSLRSSSFRDCAVAVKMLPSFADDIARSDFMQEINFMKSLKYHPHLVSMLGWVGDRKSPLLLVEYCAHGDLLHFIRERRDHIKQGYQNPSGLCIKQIVSFGWQISNGLDYLNSIGCIHRDIAARNVLIDENLTCKIGDFGLCRLTDSLLYTARGGRLPLKWMAIESLATFEYTFKSDVWSFGVLLWELLSLGDVPFAEIQTTDLLPHLEAGKRLPRPDLCTNEIYEIMSSCWCADPQSRPSFTLICGKFSQILEKATENYGYLRPTQRDSVEIDNV